MLFGILIGIAAMMLVAAAIYATACLRYRPPPDDVFHFARHYAREPIVVTVRGERIPIAYLETGKPGKPLVILWHGVGSCAGQFLEFTHQMEALADQGFHVVAPDLPGHGRTPAPADSRAYTLDALAAFMQDVTAALLARHRNPWALWFTHSLAAAGAVCWASRAATLGTNPLPRLRSIVVASLPTAPFVNFLLVGVRLPGAEKILPGLLFRFGRLYFSQYIRAITKKSDRRGLLLELYYPRSVAAVRAQVRFIRSNIRHITHPEALLEGFALHPSPSPLVFFHGSHDALFPRKWVERVVRGSLPDAPFAVCDGAGHDLIDDLPEDVAREIVMIARGGAVTAVQARPRAAVAGLAAGRVDRHRAPAVAPTIRASVRRPPRRFTRLRKQARWFWDFLLDHGEVNAVLYGLVMLYWSSWYALGRAFQIYGTRYPRLGKLNDSTIMILQQPWFWVISAAVLLFMSEVACGEGGIKDGVPFRWRHRRNCQRDRIRISILRRIKGGRDQVRKLTRELSFRSRFISVLGCYFGSLLVASIGCIIIALVAKFFWRQITPAEVYSFLTLRGYVGALVVSAWHWLMWTRYFGAESCPHPTRESIGEAYRRTPPPNPVSPVPALPARSVDSIDVYRRGLKPLIVNPSHQK